MTRYRRAATLLEVEVGSDIVALEPKLGQCFGFNEVASVVWKELEQPRSFAELRDHLMSTYDVDRERCCEELSELLADLETKKLIEAVAGASD